MKTQARSRGASAFFLQPPVPQRLLLIPQRLLLIPLWLAITLASGTCLAQSTAQPDSKSNSAIHQYGHGNDWRTNLDLDAASQICPQWSVEVGLGRGQVVGNNKTIYLTSGRSTKKGDETFIETTISAHQFSNGKELWQQKFQSKMSDQQETFGGAMATPRSTPLIIDDQIFFTSFTGQLFCIDRKTGKTRWEKDLIETFGATPVQFGFSSSLVASPKKQLVLLAAGPNGGLLNVNPKTGELNWKRQVETASYATPALANLANIPQWVIVSETAVQGIRETDGNLLWQFSLPIHGQTNVPTPVIINDSDLVISGQGTRGTRCLTVRKNEKGDWGVDEKWYQPRVEFFYTNYSMLNKKTLVGSDGKLLVAVDTRTGQLIGRHRGYVDANIVLTNQGFAAISGKGKLTIIQSKNDFDGLQVLKAFQLGTGRCWTPPTTIENHILVRIDDRLLCFEVSNKAAAKNLPNLAATPQRLDFDKRERAIEGDPAEAIFATFQTDGQEAALKLYNQLRKRGQLKIRHRVALANAAHEQDLIAVRNLILDHANEDFPGSQLIKETTKKLRK